MGDDAEIERPDTDAVDFSVQLETWLASDHDKTLGDLGDVFSEKSFAVTILFLMFVPALPLPTGGISHLFEAIAVVVALQMVFGRQTLWLPDRWRRRELSALTTDKAVPFMIRRIQWFERFTRPRGTYLFTHRWSIRIIGLILMTFAAVAALAPPFSGLDTIPSMGAVAVALSVILEDAAVLVLGVVIGAIGTAVIFAIGAAAYELVGNLF
jgi:hypothetical protein